MLTRETRPPADPAALGRRLRAYRKLRRWTQEQLAREAQVSRVTVSTIEREPGRACWDTVCRLANALEITPAELA